MMHIRSCEPMSTRPCQYCLALQDDSVFADFDINQNGCLYLVRISYDGYGCCDPNPKLGIGEINSNESKQLIGLIEKGSFEEPKASEILSRYFKENKEALWEDALNNHELI